MAIGAAENNQDKPYPRSPGAGRGEVLGGDLGAKENEFERAFARRARGEAQPGPPQTMEESEGVDCRDLLSDAPPSKPPGRNLPQGQFFDNHPPAGQAFA